MTGAEKGSYLTQRKNFCRRLSEVFHHNLPLSTPKDWYGVFELLKSTIDNLAEEQQIVLFFDEFPWMITPRSQLLEVLEYFWNEYWGNDNRIKLIICGSSASWIIKNILNNTGGLYQRVTCRFKIEPLKLNQVKVFLHDKGIKLTNQQITSLYMAIGGVPLYLEQAQKGLTADQIIDRLCFNKNGLLFDELKELFQSLFKNEGVYIRIIKEIARLFCPGTGKKHTQRPQWLDRKDHCTKAIEEKESFRWLEELREVNHLGELYPQKRFIMVADRESDIIEVLSEPLRSNVFYIIRGHHNRNLLEKDEKLLDFLKKSPVLSEIEFEIKERGKNAYRKVEQEIRVETVTIKGSPNRGNRTNLQDVKLTAILATETKAGKAGDKLEWLLLTNGKLSGLEDVLNVIKYYLLRWKIEIYFKVLKSGCRVEKLQLEGLDRLCNCLALYMIVAWRIMYLIQLGKNCSDLSCEVFFDEEEWRTAYMIKHKKPSPKKPPSLHEMIRVVASLGRFLERKSDGDPGPKHLWIGIQRIRDFVYAINVQNEVFGTRTYG